MESLTLGTWLFLGLALAIALAFEFVNGFHDTANAVATVIYTNSLKPRQAVVWSGICNFLLTFRTSPHEYPVFSVSIKSRCLQVFRGIISGEVYEIG